MKDTKNKIAVYIDEMSNGRIRSISKFAIAFLLLLGFSMATPVIAQISVGVNINVPVWAPSYDNVDQVQYYYLPDIEVYYDVWNHEFVYLDDGNWIFSPTLPPMYANYDLNNAFVVVLDANVHQPWMHFHYYVAHYPRYYYRSVYRADAGHPIHGFNENMRAAVYRGEVHQSNQRREAEVRHDAPPNRVQRQPVQAHYYGKTVGRPVKVEKQMRRPAPVKQEDHGKR